MNVEHIVARPLITLSSWSTVVEAAKQIVENDLGLLVVCGPKIKGGSLANVLL